MSKLEQYLDSLIARPDDGEPEGEQETFTINERGRRVRAVRAGYMVVGPTLTSAELDAEFGGPQEIVEVEFEGLPPLPNEKEKPK